MTTLPTFVEERINDQEIVRNSVGGPTYSTQVNQTYSGAEQRNSNWMQSLSRWEIGERQLTRRQLDYILAFFHNRKGKAVGFRFKDWGDYYCAPTQGLIQQVFDPVSGTSVWAFFKQYETPAGSVELRRITKPVAPTVKIFINGAQTTLFSLSVDGTLNFPATPAGTISWSGEFDVPVRFDVDELKYQFLVIDPKTQEAIFKLLTLPVMELRV